MFLFDEPLSNLDAKLRVQMRAEIARLHQRLKTTIIYVTHDQVEAMTLGDRIAVMDCGVIRSLDSPKNSLQTVQWPRWDLITRLSARTAARARASASPAGCSSRLH